MVKLPFDPPLQAIFVWLWVKGLICEGCVMVTLVVPVQPLASVTVTV